MPRKIIVAAGVLAAAAALAACSSGSAPGAASSPAAAPPATSAPTQPETAAGARSAAAAFFALYSAGQWDASYSSLSPAAQRVIPEATWAKVHEKCPPKAEGLAYDIKGVTVVGSTAVIRYGLSGALASLGTAEQAFTYTGGRWVLTPDDLATYRGHTARQVAAIMKAKGNC